MKKKLMNIISGWCLILIAIYLVYFGITMAYSSIEIMGALVLIMIIPFALLLGVIYTGYGLIEQKKWALDTSAIIGFLILFNLLVIFILPSPDSMKSAYFATLDVYGIIYHLFALIVLINWFIQKSMRK